MKEHIFIHKKSARGSIVAVAILLSVFIFPLAVHADTSSIINSVSVSSDGTGTAHTKTKTIINGVTVEDSTTNETGTYMSVITQNGVTTSVEATTGEAQSRDAQLLMLIQQLKVLIQYYVSLLNTK